MKKYKQLLKELPSKTVVFAFGRFNPPTIGHELLVKAVKKLAQQKKADHVIFASRSQDSKKNPLDVGKKIKYLQLMFPKTNFVAASDEARTFIEVAKLLNKKYKNIVMIGGSDRVPEFRKLLNTYNGKEYKFDTIEVISAGDRDPDADDASGMSASKMRALASKGDYSQFKRGLPSTVREIDGKRLMNDIREGMGLEQIKEQIVLVKDDLREQYFRGEIFNVGEVVESNGEQLEIVKRGSNHLLLKTNQGELISKWITDVSICEDIRPGYAPKEITFGGYTTKNFHHHETVVKEFQDTIDRKGSDNPSVVKAAIQATDTYMKLNDMHLEAEKKPDESEIKQWIAAHDHAKQYLESLGEFLHHRDYWDAHQHELELMLNNYKETGTESVQEELTNKTLKSNDKIKVARVIATMLGVDNAESSSNAENLVNLGLRKVRTKALNAETLSILDKMLALATEVGIEYDEALKPNKLKEETKDSVVVDTKSKFNIAKDVMRFNDFKKLKKMNQEKTAEEPDNDSDMDAIEDPDHEKTETEVGGLLVQPYPVADDNLRRRKIKYHLGEETETEEDEDCTEEDLEDMASDVKDWEDIIDEYEDDELSVVDDETGEEVEEEEPVNEETLMEVLSRAERIRARIRMAKTKAKRERAVKIALKRFSSSKTINKRSRRLAIKLMKKRLLRGRDLTKLSVAEKERIEKTIQKRAPLISRLAMRLAPKVRKIEKSRMSHSKFTQGAPNVTV